MDTVFEQKLLPLRIVSVCFAALVQFNLIFVFSLAVLRAVQYRPEALLLR